RSTRSLGSFVPPPEYRAPGGRWRGAHAHLRIPPANDTYLPGRWSVTTRQIATARARRLAAAAALVLALGLAGCNDDSNDTKNPVGPGGSSGSTLLTGTFTGASENGRIDLTIQTTNLAHVP